MRQDAVQYINSVIMRQAAGLRYTVASQAPNNERDLFNSTSLVIWDGASDETIYGDCRVNHAFRALHDALHLKTGMSFSPDSEIELGRIQASMYSCDLLRELVYAEVCLQAKYNKDTGLFVADQCEFTKDHLIKTSVI